MQTILWLAVTGVCVVLMASESYGQQVPLSFGKLRYAIGSISDQEVMIRNHINLAHLHAPSSSQAYNGFPARARFDETNSVWQYAAEALRAQGIHIITYIAPHMWYGNKDERTLFFDFYDNRWQDYEDILGPRPTDPITWTQLNANGKPIKYEHGGLSGYYWCINNPNTRQYVRNVIKMQVQHGSHGVFFDGPAMFGCHCDYCQQQFREYLQTHYPQQIRQKILAGTDISAVTIPTNRDNLALYTAWKKFRCWSLAQFLHDMRSWGRSLCPDFLLTNNYCLWTGTPVEIAANIGENGELYAQEVDILFDEARYGAGPHMQEDGTRFSNSFHYDYLVAAAGDVPAVCTFMGIKQIPPEAIAPLTWLEIAESWASQCTKIQQRLTDVYNQVFQQAAEFQISHPDLFVPARPWAKVGLWVSLQQGIASQKTYGMAFARLLQDEGIAYRILTDGQITDQDLDELECIVLPQIPAISDEQLAALEHFLQRGKGIVVVGAAATYDEYGLGRPPAQRGIFAEGAPEGCFRRSRLDDGRIAWADLSLFPHLPVASQTALNQPAASKLAEAIRWVTNNHLTLLQAPPLPVECRAYLVGEDAGRVYLVNYGVTKDGNVTDLENVSLTLALPKGRSIATVTAYSTQPPRQQEVSFQHTHKTDGLTATLTVPRLHIWAVLDLALQAE